MFRIVLIIFISFQANTSWAGNPYKDSLVSEVMNFGNEEAYTDLFMYLADHGNAEQIIPYDFIMAYQFNHIPAFENAFWNLHLLYVDEMGRNFSDLKKETQKIMMKILKDGKKAGSEKCGKILRRIKKTGEASVG